jgi:hypothetical protein
MNPTNSHNSNPIRRRGVTLPNPWIRSAKAVAHGVAPFLVTAAVFASAATARAEVRREGAWPEADPAVSLSLSNTPRGEALRKLAEAGGFSLVYQGPPGDPVDLHVSQQPAGKVLDMLLRDGTYVARREGDLVAVERVGVDPAPSGDAPLPTGAVAEGAAHPKGAAGGKGERPSVKGSDRTVAGGTARIEANETVHDLLVLGGTVHVLGTVTGDLLVLGGRVHLAAGSRVFGNASTVGGTVTLDDGARIDGDLMRVGGSIERAEGAVVGGKVEDGKVRVHLGDGSASAEFTNDETDSKATKEGRSMLLRVLDEVGSSLTAAAMLFVFGVVLLALGTRRMEVLKVEAAARPMHALALGVVGGIASIAVLVALCITIVGIPVAFVGVFLGILAVYAGICAVLTTAGELLLRHKTQNPYVHLAVGCGLFIAASALPFIGGFVKLGVTLLGIGVLFATRGAGLIPPRRSLPGGPYRAPAV